MTLKKKKLTFRIYCCPLVAGIVVGVVVCLVLLMTGTLVLLLVGHRLAMTKGEEWRVGKKKPQKNKTHPQTEHTNGPHRPRN